LECSERTVFVAQDVHVPVVQLVHNTMWQTSGYLSQGSQLVVFNSHNVADHHFSPHRPFVVVHPQIDPALYRCEGPHDCTTLVNLYAPKGAATLYALAKRNPRRPFLAVLGGYGDQQIDDRYPNVEFIENTPQMTAEVYARTRVLLMPSVYESFGRVAVEAAASSIPTIAAPTPGLRESLGPDGLFADPSDVESWRSLLNALDKPKAYAAAQKHALSRSAHWDAQRPRETAEFVTAMNQLYGRWEYGSADRR
jgi:glycosyltransferase involved in cell wall biosynthesis